MSAAVMRASGKMSREGYDGLTALRVNWHGQPTSP